MASMKLLDDRDRFESIKARETFSTGLAFNSHSEAGGGVGAAESFV
jgi:hypothetical protein